MRRWAARCQQMNLDRKNERIFATLSPMRSVRPRASGAFRPNSSTPSGLWHLSGLMFLRGLNARWLLPVAALLLCLRAGSAASPDLDLDPSSLALGPSLKQPTIAVAVGLKNIIFPPCPPDVAASVKDQLGIAKFWNLWNITDNQDKTLFPVAKNESKARAAHPCTIFAVPDDSFTKQANFYSSLEENPLAATEFISNHIIGGPVILQTNKTLTSIGGLSITPLQKDSGMFVNGIKVTKSDVKLPSGSFLYVIASPLCCTTSDVIPLATTLNGSVVGPISPNLGDVGSFVFDRPSISYLRKAHLLPGNYTVKARHLSIGRGPSVGNGTGLTRYVYRSPASIWGAGPPSSIGVQNDSIYQVLPGLSGTTFLTLLQLADCRPSLKGRDPVTLFMPTDEALASLPPRDIQALIADPERLRQTLLYHMAPGTFTSSDLSTNVSITTVEGKPLRTDTYGNTTLNVEGAKVILSDIIGHNGVIHIIDRFLYPVPNGTLRDLIAKTPNVNQFLELCKRVNLTDYFTGGDPYTVFAPTNDALAEIAKSIPSTPEGDKQLKAILLNHIVPGIVYTASWSPGQVLPTAGGHTIYLQYQPNESGGFSLLPNGATVAKSDLGATNGVCHIINKVMPIEYAPTEPPQRTFWNEIWNKVLDLFGKPEEPMLPKDEEKPRDTIITTLKKLPNAKEFLDAFNISGLIPKLETAEPITIFVPVNSAFDQLKRPIAELLKTNRPMVEKVLLNHIVRTELYCEKLKTLTTVKSLQETILTISPSSDGCAKVDDSDILYWNITAKNGVVHLVDTIISANDLIPEELLTTTEMEILTTTELEVSTIHEILTTTMGLPSTEPSVSEGTTIKATAPEEITPREVSTTPQEEESTAIPEKISTATVEISTELPEVVTLTTETVTSTLAEGVSVVTYEAEYLSTTPTSEPIDTGYFVPGEETTTRQPPTGREFPGPPTVEIPVVYLPENVSDMITPRPMVTFTSTTPMGPTLVDVLRQLNLTTFPNLLNMTGLDETLPREGPITIFAPTDAAFNKVDIPTLDKLFEDKEQLKRVLQYHVVPSPITGNELPRALQAVTLDGAPVFITVYVIKGTPTAFINNATISPSQHSYNGTIVYLIDMVLISPPEVDLYTTINKILKEETMTMNVNKARLDPLLTGPGPITVFVPTEAAWKKIPEDLLQKLATDENVLKDFILSHIIRGAVFTPVMTDGSTFITSNGKVLTITRDNGLIKVNNAYIINPDIVATNGVIHVIDMVFPVELQIEEVTTTVGITATTPAAKVTEITPEESTTEITPEESTTEITPEEPTTEIGSTEKVTEITTSGSEVTTEVPYTEIPVTTILENETTVTYPTSTPGVLPLIPGLRAQGLTTFAALLESIFAPKILNLYGLFTLFAPTNKAFESLSPDELNNLKNDSQALQQMLLYHAINRILPYDDINDNLQIPSIQGNNLTFNVYDNGHIKTVLGSQIVKPDIKVENGLVHIIDRPLYPIPRKTVLEVVDNMYPSFSLAINTTNNRPNIKGVTAFIPSEEFWTQLPKLTKDTIFANASLMEDLVQDHVCSGRILKVGIRDGIFCITLSGKKLNFTVKENSYFVNGIQIILFDIISTDGIIHVINRPVFEELPGYTDIIGPLPILPPTRPPPRRPELTTEAVESETKTQETTSGVQEEFSTTGATMLTTPEELTTELPIFPPTRPPPKRPELTTETAESETKTTQETTSGIEEFSTTGATMLTTSEELTTEVSLVTKEATMAPSSTEAAPVTPTRQPEILNETVATTVQAVSDVTLPETTPLIEETSTAAMPSETSATSIPESTTGYAVEPTVTPVSTIPNATIPAILEQQFQAVGYPIDVTELVPKLPDTTLYTAFIPYSVYLSGLPTVFLQDLAKNTTAVGDIFANHICAEARYSTDFKNGFSCISLGGTPITVTFQNGKYYCNGFPIIRVDVPALDGVVHFINGLLFQPTSTTPVPEHSTIPEITPQYPEITSITALTTATKTEVASTTEGAQVTEATEYTTVTREPKELEITEATEKTEYPHVTSIQPTKESTLVPEVTAGITHIPEAATTEAQYPAIPEITTSRTVPPTATETEVATTTEIEGYTMLMNVTVPADAQVTEAIEYTTATREPKTLEITEATELTQYPQEVTIQPTEGSTPAPEHVTDITYIPETSTTTYSPATQETLNATTTEHDVTAATTISEVALTSEMTTKYPEISTVTKETREYTTVTARTTGIPAITEETSTVAYNKSIPNIVQQEFKAAGYPIDVTDLQQRLPDTNLYTAFIPYSAYLSGLPSPLLQDLVTNRTAVSETMLNHICQDATYSPEFNDGFTCTSLGGQPIIVTFVNGRYYCNGFQIIRVDIPAADGVIHLISGILFFKPEVITPPITETTAGYTATAPTETAIREEATTSVTEVTQLVEILPTTQYSVTRGPKELEVTESTPSSEITTPSLLNATEPLTTYPVTVEAITVTEYTEVTTEQATSPTTSEISTTKVPTAASEEIPEETTRYTEIGETISTEHPAITSVTTETIPKETTVLEITTTEALTETSEVTEFTTLKTVTREPKVLNITEPPHVSMSTYATSTEYQEITTEAVRPETVPITKYPEATSEGVPIETSEYTATGEETTEYSPVTFVTPEFTEEVTTETVTKIIPTEYATYPSSTTAPNQTIPSIFQQQFENAGHPIDVTDVHQYLPDTSLYTACVPSALYLSNLPSLFLQDQARNRTSTTNILLDHICKGAVYSTQLQNGYTCTSLGGKTIIFTFQNNNYYCNNIPVIKVDVPTSDGVVHLINGLLFFEPETSTIPPSQITTGIPESTATVSLSTTAKVTEYTTVIISSTEQGPINATESTVYEITTEATSSTEYPETTKETVSSTELSLPTGEATKYPEITTEHETEISSTSTSKFPVTYPEETTEVLTTTEKLPTVEYTTPSITTLAPNQTISSVIWQQFDNAGYPIDVTEIQQQLPDNTLYTACLPHSTYLQTLPRLSIQDLTRNATAITGLLLNYICEGVTYSSQWKNGHTCTSLLGKPIILSFHNNQYYCNNFPIIQMDVPASDGVIHFINGLLPQPEEVTPVIETTVTYTEAPSPHPSVTPTGITELAATSMTYTETTREAESTAYSATEYTTSTTITRGPKQLNISETTETSTEYAAATPTTSATTMTEIYPELSTEFSTLTYETTPATEPTTLPAIPKNQTIPEIMEHQFKQSGHPIDVTGVKKQLPDTMRYTACIPDNIYLSTLPIQLLQELARNTTATTSVLLNHICPGEIYSSQFQNGFTCISLGGKPIFLTFQYGQYYCNNIPIIQYDIPAEDGVVHIINGLLFFEPPVVTSAEPETTTLETMAPAVTLTEITTKHVEGTTKEEEIITTESTTYEYLETTSTKESEIVATTPELSTSEPTTTPTKILETTTATGTPTSTEVVSTDYPVKTEETTIPTETVKYATTEELVTTELISTSRKYTEPTKITSATTEVTGLTSATSEVAEVTSVQTEKSTTTQAIVERTTTMPEYTTIPFINNSIPDLTKQQFEQAGYPVDVTELKESLPETYLYTACLPYSIYLAALPKIFLKDLTANTTAFTGVMQSHICQAEYNPDQKTEFTCTSLGGTAIVLSYINGQHYCNNFPIISEGIPTIDGIVYLINGLFVAEPELITSKPTELLTTITTVASTTVPVKDMITEVVTSTELPTEYTTGLQTTTVYSEATTIEPQLTEIPYVAPAHTTVPEITVTGTFPTEHAITTALPSEYTTPTVTTAPNETIPSIIKQQFEKAGHPIKIEGVKNNLPEIYLYTACVPYSSYLSVLPTTILQDFTSNETAVTNILLNLICRDAIYSSQLKNEYTCITLGGTPLVLSYQNGQYFCNKFPIIKGGVSTADGVVYFINGLDESVIPPHIAATVYPEVTTGYPETPLNITETIVTFIPTVGEMISTDFPEVSTTAVPALTERITKYPEVASTTAPAETTEYLTTSQPEVASTTAPAETTEYLTTSQPEVASTTAPAEPTKYLTTSQAEAESTTAPAEPTKYLTTSHPEVVSTTAPEVSTTHHEETTVSIFPISPNDTIPTVIEQQFKQSGYPIDVTDVQHNLPDTSLYTACIPHYTYLSRLPNLRLQDLIENNTALTSGLLGSICQGVVYSHELKDGYTCTSLRGNPIILTFHNNQYYCNNFPVIKVDVPTKDGVVYFINGSLFLETETITLAPIEVTTSTEPPTTGVTPEVTGISTTSTEKGPTTISESTEYTTLKTVTREPKVLNITEAPTVYSTTEETISTEFHEITSASTPSSGVPTTTETVIKYPEGTTEGIEYETTEYSTSEIVTETTTITTEHSEAPEIITTVEYITTPIPTVTQNATIPFVIKEQFEISGYPVDVNDLQQNLPSTSLYTACIPYSEYLATLPSLLLQDLTTNKTTITNVLLDHICPGVAYSPQFKNGYTCKSLGGKPIIFTFQNNQYHCNNFPIIKVDVSTNDGVIHFINGLLFSEPGVTPTEEFTKTTSLTTEVATEATATTPESTESEEPLTTSEVTEYSTLRTVTREPKLLNITEITTPYGLTSENVTSSELLEITTEPFAVTDQFSTQLPEITTTSELSTTKYPTTLPVTTSSEHKTEYPAVEFTTQSPTYPAVEYTTPTTTISPNDSIPSIIKEQFENAGYPIDVSGLQPYLPDTYLYTACVPYSTYLQALPKVFLQDLTINQTATTETLLDYICQGAIYSSQLKNGYTCTSLGGKPIIFTFYNDQYFCNNILVIKIDVPASNGVVHFIKDLLAPEQAIPSVTTEKLPISLEVSTTSEKEITMSSIPETSPHEITEGPTATTATREPEESTVLPSITPSGTTPEKEITSSIPETSQYEITEGTTAATATREPEESTVLPSITPSGTTPEKEITSFIPETSPYEITEGTTATTATREPEESTVLPSITPSGTTAEKEISSSIPETSQYEITEGTTAETATREPKKLNVTEEAEKITSTFKYPETTERSTQATAATEGITEAPKATEFPITEKSTVKPDHTTVSEVSDTTVLPEYTTSVGVTNLTNETIPELIEDEFKTAGYPIDITEIKQQLPDSNVYTACIPYHQYIQDGPELLLQDITTNRTAITSIILNHICIGAIFSNRFQDGYTCTSLGNTPIIFASRNGQHYCNNFLIITPDIPTTDGVVHIINGLSLPESLVIPTTLEITSEVPATVSTGAHIETTLPQVTTAYPGDITQVTATREPKFLNFTEAVEVTEETTITPITIVEPITAVIPEYTTTEIIGLETSTYETEEITTPTALPEITSTPGVPTSTIGIPEEIATSTTYQEISSSPGVSIPTTGIPEEITMYRTEFPETTSPNKTIPAILKEQFQQAGHTIDVSELLPKLPERYLYTAFLPYYYYIIHGLPTELVGDLAKNKTAVRDLFLNHICPDVTYSQEFQSGYSCISLGGPPIVVVFENGRYFVNGFPVIEKDIPTSDGVVHLIDGVFIEGATPPPELAPSTQVIPIATTSAPSTTLVTEQVTESVTTESTQVYTKSTSTTVEEATSATTEIPAVYAPPEYNVTEAIATIKYAANVTASPTTIYESSTSELTTKYKEVTEESSFAPIEYTTESITEPTEATKITTEYIKIATIQPYSEIPASTVTVPKLTTAAPVVTEATPSEYQTTQMITTEAEAEGYTTFTNVTIPGEAQMTEKVATTTYSTLIPATREPKFLNISEETTLELELTTPIIPSEYTAAPVSTEASTEIVKQTTEYYPTTETEKTTLLNESASPPGYTIPEISTMYPEATPTSLPTTQYTTAVTANISEVSEISTTSIYPPEMNETISTAHIAETTTLHEEKHTTSREAVTTEYEVTEVQATTVPPEYATTVPPEYATTAYTEVNETVPTIAYIAETVTQTYTTIKEVVTPEYEVTEIQVTTVPPEYATTKYPDLYNVSVAVTNVTGITEETTTLTYLGINTTTILPFYPTESRGILSVSIFFYLVDLSGIDATLSQGGPYTILAPVDSAFQALPPSVMTQLKVDMPFLREILLYHIIPQKIVSTDLQNDNLLTSLQGQGIRCNIYGPVITLGGAKIVMPDGSSGYGVLHIVNRVLYPVPVGTLLDTIQPRNDTDKVQALLQNTTLPSRLKGPGPFTIFLPSNRAINSLPSYVMDILEHNATMLEEFVLNHMVSGTYYTAGMSEGLELTSLGGQTLRISQAGGLTVNGVPIVSPDISVTNGVVHIIDQILFDPSQEIYIPKTQPAIRKDLNVFELTKQLNLTTFANLLVDSGLSVNLSAPGYYTVFAPTNDAFAAMPASQLDTIKSDPLRLVQILLYHILPVQIETNQMTNEMVIPSLLPTKSVRMNIYVNNRGPWYTASGSQILMPNNEASNGVVHVVHQVLYIPLGDIVQTVEKCSILQTLRHIISISGLEDQLRGGNYTLLAPNDAAFNKLPEDTLERLTLDPHLSRLFLLGHLIRGTVNTEGIFDESTLTTASNNQLYVRALKDCILLNSAAIQYPDVTADNGVVHVIDRVL